MTVETWELLSLTQRMTQEARQRVENQWTMFGVWSLRKSLLDVCAALDLVNERLSRLEGNPESQAAEEVLKVAIQHLRDEVATALAEAYELEASGNFAGAAKKRAHAAKIDERIAKLGGQGGQA